MIHSSSITLGSDWQIVTFRSIELTEGKYGKYYLVHVNDHNHFSISTSEHTHGQQKYGDRKWTDLKDGERIAICKIPGSFPKLEWFPVDSVPKEVLVANHISL